MAATATLLTSGDLGWEAAPVSTLVTGSVAPGADCALVLLTFGIYDQGGSTGNTLWNDGGGNLSIVSSGSGPTWTRQVIGTATSNPYPSSAAAFTAVVGGSDPGSFTVTIDYADTRQSGSYAYALWKVTGHDTGTTFGGKVATYMQAGQGSVTATLDAAPASGDITLAFSGADVGAGGSSPGATFGSSFGTWSQDATSTGSKQTAWVAGQRTGSTSTSVEFSDVNAGTADNFNSAQAAIVVKAAAGGGGGSTTVGRLAPTRSGMFVR